MAELQTVWGVLPALYLFLAGLAAGTFFACGVLQLARPQASRLTCVAGSWAAVTALAVGLVCLVAETEKPLAAINLFAAFTNFGSWMTIGAWLLLVAFLVYAAHAVLVTPQVQKHVGRGAASADRVLVIVGMVLSVGVAAYSAVLLMAAPAIPLWENPLIIAVFLASAADMGVACTAACHKVAMPGAHRGLSGAALAAALVEAVAIAAFLATSAVGDATQQQSAQLIVSGPLALLFWGCVVVLGIAVPVVLTITELVAGKHSDVSAQSGLRGAVLPVASAACALVGGYSLRSVVLAAGIHAAVAIPLVGMFS